MRGILLLSFLIVSTGAQAQIGLRYQKDPADSLLLLRQRQRPQQQQATPPQGMPVVDPRTTQQAMPVIHPDSSLRANMTIIKPDTIEHRRMKADGKGGVIYPIVRTQF